ncbi:hypothetical protein AAFF_G00278790 [Aldrovandia affinis]|uniref:Uncharacterized protein n=1 Tax=Aldrovandia affinis TaxID=143900 RepID=A0AAD7SRJ3_9TELE|nr:hypothetical protein AAFF_G00278790 [Aldrovandia affinis]
MKESLRSLVPGGCENRDAHGFPAGPACLPASRLAPERMRKSGRRLGEGSKRVHGSRSRNSVATPAVSPVIPSERGAGGPSADRGPGLLTSDAVRLTDGLECVRPDAQRSIDLNKSRSRAAGGLRGPLVPGASGSRGPSSVVLVWSL